MTNDTRPARAEVIAPGIGHHLHFLNHLATIKVRGGEDSALSVVEFRAPRGLGPPLHRHQDEDELFVVLDGEVAFHTDGNELVGHQGSLAFLPHGEPHTFQVRSSEATFVCVTAARSTTPVFDRMVAALGTTTATPALPSPAPIDPAVVAEVCARYGIEIVGPPPPALP